MKETEHTPHNSIRNWAEEDRPREKMLLKGIASLSNAELLAILIGSGNKDESAVQLSQRILSSANNNLNELGKRSVKALTKDFKGIGEAKAISICADLELGKRRTASDILQRESIKCSRDAYLLMHPLLADLPYEELWVILLNRSAKIITKVKISQGGIAQTSADILLIMKAAITNLASGIILCHNHPSGNIRPSQQDDHLTQKVKEAACLLDLNLLDHIVLTDGHYFSYADEAKI